MGRKPIGTPRGYADEASWKPWPEPDRLKIRERSLVPLSDDLLDDIEGHHARLLATYQQPTSEAIHEQARRTASALQQVAVMLEAPEARSVLEAATQFQSQRAARYDATIEGLREIQDVFERFAAGDDFGTALGKLAQSGDPPIDTFVRRMAGTFWLATGKWPSGAISNSPENAKRNEPKFDALLVTCFECIPRNDQPFGVSTLLDTARSTLKEMARERAEDA